MTELTKETIARLCAAEPKVKMINGFFHEAAVEAVFARHKYELRVRETHPILRQFGGPNPTKIELLLWKSCNGYRQPIPAELMPLVVKLQGLATISNDAAKEILTSMNASIRQFEEDMGFSLSEKESHSSPSQS